MSTSAAKTSTIQLLSRQDYTKQKLITLPTPASTPLPSGSIRLQTNLLSLTANNLSYARIGHLPVLNWWSVHPLTPTLPQEYSDPTQWGRMNTWGYATVLDSAVEGIPAGSQVYGYLPLGDLPQNIEVVKDGEMEGQFICTSEYRQSILKIYNRYLFYPSPSSSSPSASASASAAQDSSRGYDALMRVLFETAYLMNTYIFSSNPSTVSHPAGKGTDGSWTTEQADIAGATVVCLAASGKTGLSFGALLRYSRTEADRPKRVIAVGSDLSADFTRNTGFFDVAANYGDVAPGVAIPESLGLKGRGEGEKVVLINFGARGTAMADWEEGLAEKGYKVQTLSLSGGLVNLNPEDATEAFMKGVKSGKMAMNAGPCRDAVLKSVGAKVYFEGMEREWNTFKRRGGIPGLSLKWGKGMEDVEKGWNRLCQGGVPADEGLLYEI